MTNVTNMYVNKKILLLNKQGIISNILNFEAE